MMLLLTTIFSIVITLSLLVSAHAAHINGAPVEFPGVYVFTDGSRVVKIGLQREVDLPGGELLSGSENIVKCLDFGNRNLLDDVEESSVRFVNEDELSMLLDICNNSPSVGQDVHRHKRFIVPGTKWCGLGNVASDYTQLGSDAGTDRCCRTHDHCPDHISPFQTKYGITNWSILYRFNCACEERFFNCLKSVTNESASSLVGRVYFNLLQPKCFKVDHPTKCQKKGWWFLCKKKVLDTTKPKAWRFYKFWKSF